MTPGMKELKQLEVIVAHWRERYSNTPDDNQPGWEFLADDLASEIKQLTLPYVNRMAECESISGTEAACFFGWCHGQVETLREELKNYGIKPGDS